MRERQRISDSLPFQIQEMTGNHHCTLFALLLCGLSVGSTDVDGWQVDDEFWYVVRIGGATAGVLQVSGEEEEKKKKLFLLVVLLQLRELVIHGCDKYAVPVGGSFIARLGCWIAFACVQHKQTPTKWCYIY